MNNVEVVNRLAEILGTTGSHIIELYARWYVIQICLWLGFAVGLLALGIICILKFFKEKKLDWGEHTDSKWSDELLGFTLGAGCCTALIGVIILIVNTPTLFHMEAYCIRKLLTQLSGSEF